MIAAQKTLVTYFLWKQNKVLMFRYSLIYQFDEGTSLSNRFPKLQSKFMLKYDVVSPQKHLREKLYVHLG